MTQNTLATSSYKITNIILIESSFQRERLVTLDPLKIVSNVDLNATTEKDIDPKKFTVFLEANYECGKKPEEGQLLVPEIKFRVKFAGIFEIEGDSTLDFDIFSKINAPAIIFPFIREYFIGVSTKAALPPIVLPLINFTN